MVRIRERFGAAAHLINRSYPSYRGVYETDANLV